ncbi:hypothetical protein HK099_007756 [Clydaea vesicula]|uniref:Uncharacterized protein n=1 Tax=Clydaea vesicula TaxID=447962 RepID=A0AAD5TW25_9FUNG|nr:hypothetical protein HK099_007756 [Clydaea vesicula]KAJ3381337.1 hypothetical protein HDU92_005460 [Lobulomyces angularis]
MNNSLIWNPSKDSKNPNFAFTENSINYLKSLSEFFELHLIFKVDSDKQQEQIQSILKNTGLFFDKDEDFLSQQEQSEIENNSDSYIIDSRRILFCSTEKGKIHLVRHIKPFLHIDSNKEDVIELSPYVEKLIFCKKTKLPNNQHHSLHSKEDYNINTCSNGLKLQVNQSNTGKGLVGLSRTNSYNTLLVNNNKQQQHNTKENGRISNTSSDSDSDDNFFDGTLNVEVIDLAEFRLEE